MHFHPASEENKMKEYKIGDLVRHTSYDQVGIIIKFSKLSYDTHVKVSFALYPHAPRWVWEENLELIGRTKKK